MKNIEYKTIEATIKQAGDEGSFEAVIATFDVIDKDGDIVEHGAFGDSPAMVLPAHDQGHVPLGKAHVEERGDLAIAVGQFNMDIPAARDWHSALKFDLDHPPAVQEWSWGFNPIKAPTDTIDGETIRRLQELDMREFSPVLRGASIGTGTLSAKRLKAEGMNDQDLRALLEQALNDKESDVEHIWVEAVFEDVVVYTLHTTDEASRTFERDYSREGNSVSVGSEQREVVREVSYRPVGKELAGSGLKLSDQIRLTMCDVGTLVGQIREVAEGRKERGRKLGKEVSVEALAMAEGCHELDRALQQLKDMAEGMLPEEAIAKAAAKFLAHDTYRHRVIS